MLTKVALDPTRGDTLWDDTESLLSDPGDQDLSGIHISLFGDLLDFGRIDDARLSGDVVTQG